jgi:signal transduction histidine kinase
MTSPTDSIDPVPAPSASAVERATERAALTVEREVAPTPAERFRLAHELHDAITQALFAANLVAGTLHNDPALPAAVRAQARTLAQLNQGALAGMRMLMFELRPEALSALSLRDLLQQVGAALSARGEIDVQVHVDPLDPPPELRIELYRVAQEALSNVVRHSTARNVHLRWQAGVTAAMPSSGRLTVRDDGRGFDTAAPHPSQRGLARIQRRTAALGGTLGLRSTPGAGTTVEVEVSWAT